MKHITSFTATLLLWLCCALTAWADGITVAETTTAPADITEGYYVIKVRFKSSGGWKNYYVYHNSTGDRRFRIKEEGSVDLTALASNMQYAWYITKNASGQFVLQNASTGGFFPADATQGGNCNSSTAVANAAILQPVEFTSPDNLETLAGAVHLKQCNNTNNGSALFIHCNQPSGDPNLSYWTGNNVDGTAVQFTFYKLTGATSTVVTPAIGTQITYQKDGVTVSTAWSAGLKASTIPNAHKSYFYSTTDSKTYEDAITSAIVINYTKGTCPVTFSTPESPVWYKLTTRNNRSNGVNNYVVASGNEAKTGTTSGNSHYGASYQTDIKSLYGAYWAFVEDGFGIKLYNKGTKKFVTVASRDAKATFNDNGTTFFMQTSSASGANFSLQYSNTWGYLGDHQSGCLGTWSHDNTTGAQNDEGSGYKFIAVDESDLTIASTVATALKTTYPTLSAQTNAEGALVLNSSAENVATWNETMSSITLPATDWTELDKLNLDVNLAAVPDLSAYYRIRNVNSDLTNRYLSSENIVVGTDGSLNTAYTASNNMDRKVTRTSDNANFGSQLWRFTKNNDGTYTLRNANTDREMGEAGTNIEMPINIGYGNGHYTFKPYSNSIEGYDANSMFVMYDVASNQVGANSGDDYVSRNNDHYTDKSNYWQILQVTEVPVTIKGAGWASVSYPFAVKVPTESGVKAYIAETAEGNVLTLKEIEDGIIPANTGVLLAKEGGCTVNLPLTTTTASYASVNKLVGTAAERTGYTTETTYVLSAKGGNVGLLPSTLTFVPSNKAFLPKTNITTPSAETQMLNFYVNGSITGISQIAATDQEAAHTYYDLNGRRVLYPTHGIYVTGNGKKVFIK